MYIRHRKLNQPKSGRRVLPARRLLAIDFEPERRDGIERRVVPDRRQAAAAQ